MSYVLEAPKENERLTQQNKSPEFDPLFDLKQFNLSQPETILDAGCGAGDMTRLLEQFYTRSRIVGVDSSFPRVSQLKKGQLAQSKIEYICADLKAIPFNDDSFDVILVRYVFQHLSAADVLAVLSELYRCLKPNGKLFIVDIDGYFESLYPTTPTIKKCTQLLSNAGILDLNVGRKLPTYLEQRHFEKIHWDLKICTFQYKARSRELTRMIDRLEHSTPVLQSLGMSKEETDLLKQETAKILSKETSVCYLNRFYISATKAST